MHPYTIGLLKSKPIIGKTNHNERLYSIPGQVPNPINMPENCHFNERCEFCQEGCKEKNQNWYTLETVIMLHALSTHRKRRKYKCNRENEIILDVQNLKKYFPIRGGLITRTVGHVKAVDGISFKLRRGETLGIVGESGCGKSTAGRTILRLHDITDGKVIFKGEDLAKMFLKRKCVQNVCRCRWYFRILTLL